MDRDNQLRFCQICKNQKFKYSEGIICGLTNKIADFEMTCDSYVENLDLKKSLERNWEGNTKKGVGLDKRITNYAIDSLILSILTFIVAIIFGITIGLFFPESISILNEDNELPNVLIFLIVAITYFSFFESMTGRTVGKYITKTKVVDENGNLPKLKTILLRSVCRFIPFEQLSFLGEDNSGWHDKLSVTKVVEI
jgi:uncharacterized RDD family membrane protein YckC